MDNPQEAQEDEIDLREYINVIIKRKKIILSVFFIAVLAAAVFSFIQPKVYKATATIMLTTTNAEYKAMIKSDAVLDRVISKTNLKDTSGKALTAEDLSPKLTVKEGSPENIVQLEAVDLKAQEAKEIVNTWAREYTDYIGELSSKELSDLTHQFEISCKDLAQAKQRLNNFKVKNNLDLTQADIDIKKEALEKYKKEIIHIDQKAKIEKYTLEGLKKQIAGRKEIIVVPDAKNSAKIDPLYVEIETRIINIETDLNIVKLRVEFLNNDIESLTKGIREEENDVFQKGFELNKLTDDVNMAKSIYNIYSDKIVQARATRMSQPNDVEIVLSPAVAPGQPMAQGKFKKALLMGIFGIIAGIFLAFCMEFWQKSKLK